MLILSGAVRCEVGQDAASGANGKVGKAGSTRLGLAIGLDMGQLHCRIELGPQRCTSSLTETMKVGTLSFL